MVIADQKNALCGSDSVEVARAESCGLRSSVVTAKYGNGIYQPTDRTGGKPGSSFRTEPYGGRAVHPAVHGLAQVRSVIGQQAERRTAQAAVALGNTAKSSLHQDSEDGQKKAHRALKYQALSQGRSWLVGHAKAEKPEAKPGDVYRTADCRFVNHGQVGVNLSVVHKAAHYSGLVTCGSVWACPVCASRIQERRRPEVQKAIDWAKVQGYSVVMVTFTFPHKSWHSLDDLLTRQKDAFMRLRKGRPWDTMKADRGYMGLIRSLEVTHGSNGWHPHTHELWFLKGSPEGLHSLLASLWVKACAKAGLVDVHDEKLLEAFIAYGVDVKKDVDCGDYLAKQDDSRRWGFAEEVSKATSKSGRAKGVHPHHFLVRKAPGDSARFIEYVQAMKGRRQLFWSPGLKDTVGLEDVSDEALAYESREAAELLGMLTPEDWLIVRGNDARAELLDAAEQGGWKAIQALLMALRL